LKRGQITGSTADVCSEHFSTVLDTNIVLDLFVFEDLLIQPLKRALIDKSIRWIATQAMREELVRVLSYPQIVKSLKYHALDASQVLAQFDALSHIVDVPPKAGVTCKDRDDQKFIDLAVAHRGTLLSKDKAVLCMKKRLLCIGVIAKKAI
jgi:putative PIN family toxin of toxin-antitoxin system